MQFFAAAALPRLHTVRYYRLRRLFLYAIKFLPVFYRSDSFSYCTRFFEQVYRLNASSSIFCTCKYLYESSVLLHREQGDSERASIYTYTHRDARWGFAFFLNSSYYPWVSEYIDDMTRSVWEAAPPRDTQHRYVPLPPGGSSVTWLGLTTMHQQITAFAAAVISESESVRCSRCRIHWSGGSVRRCCLDVDRRIRDCCAVVWLVRVLRFLFR